ncbi:MAG: type I 3-dehydroquinate dehydratase [Gammaproteobacteria bacterium]|nr:type I 3-dehydroquinate dehydratase [Gammaproteobacteria bacterium]MCH9763355.1 type I 3-dehydroquinate dehydratase [Gammaproteobacteria bacterium]
MTMITAIIAETTISNLEKAIHATQGTVDIMELRLDYLTQINQDIPSITNLISQIKIPYIITLRSTTMGGHFKGTEAQRLTLLYALAALNPNYIDIESFVTDAFITELHTAYPVIKIIRSYHHFSDTPEDLDTILSRMLHPHVSAYKIVTYATTALDNLRVLHFIQKHTEKFKLVAHCMGALGLPSRVIGAALGNYFTYASINKNNAPVPDCPDVNSLLHTYNLKQLNKKTKICALLGNPVEQSIGHFFHNKQLNARKINAVYVKIKLNPDELTAFFELIKTLPFHGLSITMPLKEKVMTHIDMPDLNCQSIGAANTILIKNQQLYATNTDGVGALDAIEEKQAIQGRHVLIIGAGGAAKAIAHECARRQPLSITILNRTLSTAEALAKQVSGTAYDINLFNPNHINHIDMIIHTIPDTDSNAAWILKIIKPYRSNKLTFMSIDYSKKSSLLLTQVKNAGCTLINPSEMYTNQALKQIEYWFNELILPQNNK